MTSFKIVCEKFQENKVVEVSWRSQLKMENDYNM